MSEIPRPEVSRFELEDSLTALWGTKEDLELLYEEVVEGEPPPRPHQAPRFEGRQGLQHLRGNPSGWKNGLKA